MARGSCVVSVSVTAVMRQRYDGCAACDELPLATDARGHAAASTGEDRLADRLATVLARITSWGPGHRKLRSPRLFWGSRFITLGGPHASLVSAAAAPASGRVATLSN